MSLKQKTISGLVWSFAGNFAGQITSFVVGIILARLLSPREYGLIGMIVIFIALTRVFINSGFSQALIRKKDCSETDFSTVFYFNSIAGIIFYILIYFAAPYISVFFGEPDLIKITRVIGLIIIIEALTIIQTVKLTKEVNFKLQTQVKLFASFFSGSLGVILAFKDCGVWSLVFKSIAESAMISSLLWIFNHWRPQKKFNFQALKELFGFSSKLLASDIIDKIYSNIFNLVIAKFFSAVELGLYTRGQMFKNLASETLTEVVGKVSFPVMSSIQNEPNRLKANYRTILLSTQYIISILMFILAAIAEPLILTLIGEKWAGAIIYLQLLCFVGILYPLHAVSRNIMYVFGEGSMVLKLKIITKALALPAILAGIFLGIIPMVVVMIFSSIIEMMIKINLAGKLVNYPIRQQLKDMASSFFIALFIGAILFGLNHLLSLRPIWILALQLLTGVSLTILISEVTKNTEYKFLKQIAKEGYLNLVS